MAFHALLLAIASSTDNFAVGFSLGLHSLSYHSYKSQQQQQQQQEQQRHHLLLLRRANIIISLSNGLGALWATWLGSWTTATIMFHSSGSNAVPTIMASMLATIAFANLAYNEYHSAIDHKNSTTGSRIQHQSKKANPPPPPIPNSIISILVRLAIPMTLNNLAGGIAGGAVWHISPWLSAMCATIASYGMMRIGYAMACHCAKAMLVPIDNTTALLSSHGKYFSNPAFWSCSIFSLLALISFSQVVRTILLLLYG